MTGDSAAGFVLVVVLLVSLAAAVLERLYDRPPYANPGVYSPADPMTDGVFPYQ